MKRVLIAGDSLAQSTGLAYVSSNILRQFVTLGYTAAYAVITGADMNEHSYQVHGDACAETCQNVPYFNTQITIPERVGLFDEAVAKFRPELVITFHDPWWVEQIAYSQYLGSFTWVAYTTVEVPEYPRTILHPSPFIQKPRKSLSEILSRADLIIPVTKMGQAALQKLSPDNVGSPVYNGIDLREYSPEPIDKSEVFGPAVRGDEFVFMTMGVNSDRKQLYRVLLAFARFLDKMGKGRDRYKLYMHTDLTSRTGGTDLSELMTDLNIEKQVMTVPGLEFGKGISKADLIKRYRASDCIIGLPGGEGFGYLFAEAMACGKPVIYTNYGGHTEYCTNAGIAVDIDDYGYARNSIIKWGLADIESAAKAMAKIVSNDKRRISFGHYGREYAETNFDWNTVFPQLYQQCITLYEKVQARKMPGIFLRRVV